MTQPITATSVLDAAASEMKGRAGTYDQPQGERSMAKTIAIFNLHHGTNLTECQGWHLMEILKDVRYFASPTHHHDSAVDGVAYAALRAEAGAVERAPVQPPKEERDLHDWHPIQSCHPSPHVRYDIRFSTGGIMRCVPGDIVSSYQGVVHIRRSK